MFTSGMLSYAGVESQIELCTIRLWQKAFRTFQCLTLKLCQFGSPSRCMDFQQGMLWVASEDSSINVKFA